MRKCTMNDSLIVCEAGRTVDRAQEQIEELEKQIKTMENCQNCKESYIHMGLIGCRAGFCVDQKLWKFGG